MHIQSYLAFTAADFWCWAAPLESCWDTSTGVAEESFPLSHQASSFGDSIRRSSSHKEASKICLTPVIFRDVKKTCEQLVTNSLTVKVLKMETTMTNHDLCYGCDLTQVCLEFWEWVCLTGSQTSVLVLSPWKKHSKLDKWTLSSPQDHARHFFRCIHCRRATVSHFSETEFFALSDSFITITEVMTILWLRIWPNPKETAKQWPLGILSTLEPTLGLHS